MLLLTPAGAKGEKVLGLSFQHFQLCGVGTRHDTTVGGMTAVNLNESSLQGPLPGVVCQEACQSSSKVIHARKQLCARAQTGHLKA